jgi:hypothetical protein
MEVLDKNEGAVPEVSGCKRVMDSDDAAIDNFPPFFDGRKGDRIAEFIAYST